MPLILGANSVSGGYEIDNSLRFNSGSSDYLSRTPASAGNRKTWTYSVWIKRSSLTGGALLASTNNNILGFSFTNADDLSLWDGNTSTMNIATTQLFRDISAWYHIVVAFDTTQATASNRVKFYINGVQVTNLSRTTYPTQNADFNINNNTAQNIGRTLTPSDYFNGYMSEINFIDGQALTPSSFGETDEDTGIWKPKAYTGTFGTNGFYLEFQNSGALGTDSSGNGNNFTVNNLTSIDQTTDTPTNNFCTMNPLDKSASVTLTNGNLTVSTSASNVGVFANFAVTQGKWYFEVVRDNSSGTPSFGIAKASWGKSYVGNTDSIGYHSNGIIYNNGSSVQSGLATYTTSDVIGIRLDLDGGSITFYKNDVQVGTAVTGLSGEYFPAIAGQVSSLSSANFGNPPFTISSGNADANGYGNFEYQPPSGYLALCTANLATDG